MKVICDAIEQRCCLSFSYKGKMRTVEPHLLGYDNDGDLTLSAWQLSGGSGQNFRDFHVSKLSGLSISQSNFSGARQGYNPNDKTIRQIVCRL
jgi:predicted DNA-binding transcriptional regulator YafY